MTAEKQLGEAAAVSLRLLGYSGPSAVPKGSADGSLNEEKSSVTTGSVVNVLAFLYRTVNSKDAVEPILAATSEADETHDALDVYFRWLQELKQGGELDGNVDVQRSFLGAGRGVGYARLLLAVSSLALKRTLSGPAAVVSDDADALNQQIQTQSAKFGTWHGPAQALVAKQSAVLDDVTTRHTATFPAALQDATFSDSVGLTVAVPAALSSVPVKLVVPIVDASAVQLLQLWRLSLLAIYQSVATSAQLGPNYPHIELLNKSLKLIRGSLSSIEPKTTPTPIDRNLLLVEPLDTPSSSSSIPTPDELADMIDDEIIENSDVENESIAEKVFGAFHSSDEEEEEEDDDEVTTPDGDKTFVPFTPSTNAGGENTPRSAIKGGRGTPIPSGSKVSFASMVVLHTFELVSKSDDDADDGNEEYDEEGDDEDRLNRSLDDWTHQEDDDDEDEYTVEDGFENHGVYDVDDDDDDDEDDEEHEYHRQQLAFMQRQALSAGDDDDRGRYHPAEDASPFGSPSFVTLMQSTEQAKAFSLDWSTPEQDETNGNGHLLDDLTTPESVNSETAPGMIDGTPVKRLSFESINSVSNSSLNGSAHLSDISAGDLSGLPSPSAPAV